MTSPPDKLFKDRFNSYQQSPPGSAWKRIEKNLDQKTVSKVLLFKIAATILFLVMCGYLFWPNAESQENPVVKQTAPVIEQTEVPTLQSSKPVPSDIVEQAEEVVHSKNSVALKGQHVVKRVEDELHKEQEVVEPTSIKDTVNTSIESYAVIEHTPKTGLKKVYSSGEVQSRFLKKGHQVQAPAEIIESKTVEKESITDIVYDLKSNEKGLGDLRQIKNGLMAFEFGSNQNKNNKNK